jgi:Tetratricopeptide repeat
MVALGRSVSSRMAVVVVGILLAAPAALAAPPAGDPAAVNKVTDLNRKALAAYSQQDWDTARDLLKEALQICADANLDQHPITARTHLHFGAVAIVGFKQREAGIKQFKKALEIQPDIKLTKTIVTPELTDAFEEAQLASTGGNEGAGTGGGEAGGDTGGEGASAGATDEEGGEETPHRRPPKPRPRKPSDEDEGGSEGGNKGSFYLGLTIGSGAGIASGEGHLNPAHKLSGPGFAPAQLGQVEPQIGYFVTPSVLLSGVLRLQYVSGTNGQIGCGSDGKSYCNPVSLAAAGLARLTWLLGNGPFIWTVGGQIGAGYVAHAVAFTQTNCGTAGNTQCVDAVLGGPFLIGPTLGFWYELGSSLGLLAAINTEIGAPKFTFNFDIDVGLGFRL